MQKAYCGDGVIGFAQSPRQQRDKRFQHLGAFAGKLLECGTSDKLQRCVAHGCHGRRTRQAVDHRKFTDKGSRPDKTKNPLATGPRYNGDLEESFFNAVTTVTVIASLK